MKVLITAGPVYGPLDDNKLVSNRSRGLWTLHYARRLFQAGHHVTALVADTLSTEYWLAHNIQRHKGFDDYHRRCLDLVRDHDAAIMAAAVVNWIPAEPIKGKMPTEGYKPGDRISVPFYLAPRVIDELKRANPSLTLIGCKMLSGSNTPALIEAAYHTLLNAHANAVVANDLQALKTKHLVYQDRSVFTYENDFEGLFSALDAILADEHYRTQLSTPPHLPSAQACAKFDAIIAKYRTRFVQRSGSGDRVFGAVLVRDGQNWLVSPREKAHMFTAKDATLVTRVEGRVVNVEGPKATLNAPLLIRVAEQFHASAVIHLHEQLEGVPTESYAPPGTVRDNERKIPGKAFNIEGHGFVRVEED